ncbi:helix-hairpin-helix domain-containing protein [Nocardia halotolerans]|uniref:Helix-hairpin-helix domain-containing protein n=1 Tax=Nocardia halotolerans TaxID=1755878 RepID=A0ABV8V9E3_9NOCA
MSRHEEHERVRQRLGGLAVHDAPRSNALEREEAGDGAVMTDQHARVGAGRWGDDELPVGEVPPGQVGKPGWLDDGADARGRNSLVPARFRQARLDPGRRGALALGVVGLVAMVLTAVMVVRDRPVAQSVPSVPAVRAEAPTPRSDPTAVVAAVANSGPSENIELVVSVVGLVERAGLHRVPGGARVADAIEIAGGARAGADLVGLNLAQRLTDGDQVVVGASDPQSGQPRLGSAMISAAGSGPGRNSVGAGPDTNITGGAGRVDLNTATEAELDALPGVGPVTAKAILAWRATNGRFTEVTQLSEVDGIGPARLARLRDLVTT